MRIEEEMYWAYEYWTDILIVPLRKHDDYYVAVRAVRGDEVIEIEATTWDNAIRRLFRVALAQSMAAS